MQLLILDRDGVVNKESTDFVKSPDEWQPLPGSLDAISRLTHADYRIVIATNQSGIARGLFDIATLNAVHDRMHKEVAAVGGHIEAIFFCPHGPDEGCACRKPAPGLFTDIAARLRVRLDGVPIVGDRLADLNVARTVGARPMLVRTGYGQETEASGTGLDGVEVFDNLLAVADALLYAG